MLTCAARHDREKTCKHLKRRHTRSSDGSDVLPALVLVVNFHDLLRAAREQTVWLVSPAEIHRVALSEREHVQRLPGLLHDGGLAHGDSQPGAARETREHERSQVEEPE